MGITNINNIIPRSNKSAKIFFYDKKKWDEYIYNTTFIEKNNFIYKFKICLDLTHYYT